MAKLDCQSIDIIDLLEYSKIIYVPSITIASLPATNYTAEVI